MTNKWVNWAGDQRCTPAAIATPASRSELAALLRRAAAAGQRVRAVGSGHSFTDTCLTDGLLIDMSRFNRILGVDYATQRVRMEAGITLRAANAALHAHGLAFPNLGDIDQQTLAGATATGTHGTGATLANLSAALHSVEVMLADGTLVELNAESDPQGWRAIRVGLGALGIVTTVTVQLVPAFVLEGIERPTPLTELLNNLDPLIEDNDHFEFFLFAHSDLAMTKRNNRVDQSEQPRGKIAEWCSDTLTTNYLFDALCRLGRRQPRLVPWIHRAAAHAGSYRQQVDRSYRVFTSPRLLKFTEMEFAIPQAHSRDAIQEIKEISTHFASPMPIEVRWVAADDAYLSPATRRATCYIAVHMYQGMAYEPYFRACSAVFEQYQGRPHWGKRHFHTADQLSELYPEWDSFLAARRRFDPQGQFANDYLHRVLGPVR